MKIIPLPQTEEQRRRKRAALHRVTVAYSAGVVVCAVLAILLALGLFAAVIVFEFTSGLESSLLYILLGAFAAAAIALALAAFGLNVLGRRHRDAELDFRERLDGEGSFFVGDGTLATFGEGGIVIHGEEQSPVNIRVPYGEMRFLSVCTRRVPREKGVWSVIFEIPAHYLAKEGSVPRDAKPALVQADAKPRLYAAMEKFGLTCLGERQPDEKAAGEGGKEGEKSKGDGAKFSLLEKFSLPIRAKRRNALIMTGVGGAMVVAGVLLGVFWQITAGAMLGALGAMFAARSLFAFARAKGSLGIYAEGLYWRDSDLNNSVFLKWEEIESIDRIADGDAVVYRVRCAYGAYHFPVVPGSLEALKKHRPEKFGERA